MQFAQKRDCTKQNKVQFKAQPEMKYLMLGMSYIDQSEWYVRIHGILVHSVNYETISEINHKSFGNTIVYSRMYDASTE